MKLLLLIMSLFIVQSNYTKNTDSLEQEVSEVEKAFARTMANRDFEGFKSFIDDEAVFLGTKGPLRGKKEVTEAWKSLFESKQPPFSWQPETVMVLESGNLAYSTGPVKDDKGVVNFYYSSVWRKNDQGKWKIILDKGQKVCSAI
ncbi:MAG: nuclear transport factor 2 family protein [Gammaproteobacteria bacterium]|nr:nuclear transport factor 2 family protein [Gammaproteobacteria bacterium]